MDRMEFDEFFEIMAENRYEMIDNRELYGDGINILYKKLNRDNLEEKEARNISEAFHTGFVLVKSREKGLCGYLGHPFLRYG